MGSRARACAALALAAGVALVGAGCGSSAHRGAGAPSAARSSAPGGVSSPHTDSGPSHQATIGVFSAARNGNQVIKPRYTCSGADVSPPLEWVGAPANTAEFLVFVRSIWHGRVSTGWALAGIPPKVTSIGEGTLPKGAIVGRNSFGEEGYHLCPPAGKPALITFAVYAFPHSLHLRPGFDPEALTHSKLLVAPELQWGGLAMLAGEAPGR